MKNASDLSESQAAPLSAPAAKGQRIEFWIAVILTVWIVILHVKFLCCGGPLWRDEAGTVSFANMPTVREIWQNLRYDNFPPLFVMLARCWTLTGLTSDLGYRILGFLVGMVTLGTLWFCIRAFGRRAPLLVLALYAISPLSIRAGDALRPYGLGIALGLLTFSLIWRFVQKPDRRRFLWATLAAMLSVQCLYQNVLLIAAFCGGAWVVTLSRKEFKTAWQIGLIAFVAAVSLLPYWGNISTGRGWLEISRMEIHFDLIWSTFDGALAASGSLMPPIWLGFFFLSLVAAAFYGIWRQRWDLIYVGTVLLLSTILHFVFFRLIQQPPSHWYFLTMMAPAALAIDVVAATLEGRLARMGRAAISFILVLMCAVNCYSWMKLRQSNIDLVAEKLKQESRPGDLIVVYPYFYGVSLHRYLDANNWTTLPPLAETRIHRYDLIRKAMESENPMRPLLDEVRTTLGSGHTLWIVGTIALPGKDTPEPEIYPPHQGAVNQEITAQYYASWNAQFGYFVGKHALRAEQIDIPVPNKGRVYAREDVPLLAFHGWHE